MNVVIIGNKPDTDLLDINKIKSRYPNIKFTVSENIVETDKNSLVIFMKEFDSYDIKGKKSLFLEKEIELNKKSSFFLISFDKMEINISKIKHLIDIFLD